MSWSQQQHGPGSRCNHRQCAGRRAFQQQQQQQQYQQQQYQHQQHQQPALYHQQQQEYHEQERQYHHQQQQQYHQQQQQQQGMGGGGGANAGYYRQQGDESDDDDTAECTCQQSCGCYSNNGGDDAYGSNACSCRLDGDEDCHGEASFSGGTATASIMSASYNAQDRAHYREGEVYSEEDGDDDADDDQSRARAASGYNPDEVEMARRLLCAALGR